MIYRLTGRTRFRSDRRKGREILVLQVEADETYGGTPSGDNRLRAVIWRDATTFDLSDPVLQAALCQRADPGIASTAAPVYGPCETMRVDR